MTPWLERIGCSKIELKKLVTDCSKTYSPGSALAKASRLGLFGVEEDYGSNKKDYNAQSESLILLVSPPGIAPALSTRIPISSTFSTSSEMPSLSLK